jgi:hypothetical protein
MKCNKLEHKLRKPLFCKGHTITCTRQEHRFQHFALPKEQLLSKKMYIKSVPSSKIQLHSGAGFYSIKCSQYLVVNALNMKGEGEQSDGSDKASSNLPGPKVHRILPQLGQRSEGRRQLREKPADKGWNG